MTDHDLDLSPMDESEPTASLEALAEKEFSDDEIDEESGEDGYLENMSTPPENWNTEETLD